MPRKTTATRLHLLTAREVQAAKTGDYSDGGGLTLRVNDATNSASWVLRFTAPSGKRREAGLGPAIRGSLKQAGDTLTAARDAAHEARELLRRGIDPLDERDKRREAAREAEKGRKAEKDRERWTLARCGRDYHERVIERTRSTIHAAQWIASLENHIPASLWHRPIVEITPPQLLQALEAAKPHERARRAGDLGETLRRIRQRLDAIWEDAIFYGRATTNPAAAIKRKLGESRPVDEQQHLAALDYRQVPALMARIRAMPGTAARALEFGVLTASRTKEILLAEWREIDLEAKTWTIPKERMKGKEEHTVYLSPRAVEILAGQVGQDARYVFPTAQSGREGLPMSNATLLALLGRIGVRDRTTVHGLCRASFSTWSNETGAGRPDVVEACLAHREQDRIRASYNRAQFADERRALLNAWGEYLAKPVALALAA